MKKNDIFARLENAPDDIINELSTRAAPMSKMQSARILRASERKAKVTARRRAVPYAFAAVCAAAVFITLNVLDIKRPPNLHPADSTATTDIAPAADRKALLYKKMLDCVDNYDCASGTVITNMIGAADDEYKLYYSLNMKTQRAYELVLCENAATRIETRVNGTNVSTAQTVGTEQSSDTLRGHTKDDCTPRTGTQYRIDPTNLPFSSSVSLFPQELIFGLLGGGSQWDITGTENYANRQCVCIAGTVGAEYDRKFGIIWFKLMADEKTGVVLFFEGYDTEDKTARYIHTETFTDEEADVPQADEISRTDGGQISEQSIAGTWYLESSLWNDRLTIDKYGNFTCTAADGSVTHGTVRLEEGQKSDGTQTFFFRFYDDGGELWNEFIFDSFFTNGELSHESPKESYFRREQDVIDKYEQSGELAAYFGTLVGTYRNENSSGKITSVTVRADGTFTAYGKNGSSVDGRLRLSSQENGDGTETLVCSMIFDESGETYLSFAADGFTDLSSALVSYGFTKDR